MQPRRTLSLGAKALFIAAGSHALAHAQPLQRMTSDDASVCIHLLDPTIIKQQSSIAARYAYDQLKTADDKTNQSSNGSAVIPYIDIGASGGEAFSQEQNRMEQLGIHWSLDDSASYAARFIPQYQTQAFVDCIGREEAKQDGNVAIAFDDSVNNRAHFTLRVHALQGVSIQRQLLVWTNGIPRGHWKHTFEPGSNSVDLSIDWPDPGQPLVVRARMKQAGAEGSLLGTSDAKYILQPEVKQIPVHHSSLTLPAQAPGRTNGHWGLPGTYTSGVISVRAENDEVLVAPVLTPVGTWVHPNKGTKPLSCNEFGIMFDKNSDPSNYILGNVFCRMWGEADENPGYAAHFEVDGVRLIPTRPSGTITMTEKEYASGDGVPEATHTSHPAPKKH